MSGISVKLIKPKPLKRGAMDKNFRAAAQKASIDMAKDMTKITSGWSDGGVKFVGKVESKRDSFLISAKPENPRSKRVEVWGFLDKGTKRHEIKPKKPGGKLSFVSGYKAGSKPNTVTTAPSRRFGPKVVTDKVMHPGFPARNWIKLRTQKWRKKIKDYAVDGMKLAVKESGHEYKR